FTQYRNDQPVYFSKDAGNRGVYSCKTGRPEWVVKRKELDRIDRRILKILQKEGRIPFTELGERVGLSTTPCTERVRRMERDGVITGYHARVSPEAVGAGLLVFVEISLAY